MPRAGQDGPDRIETLEHRLAAFEEALRSLDRRLSALEGGSDEEPAPIPDAAGAPAETLGGPVEPGGILSLAGRSFLVLGGAFLIRALTEAGALARPAGVIAGLTYAAGWLLLGDRAGRKGRVSSAAFHGITAVLIAYPLLWEASTRLGVLTPGAAVLAVGITAAISLAAAWRQEGPILSWAVTIAAVLTLISLLASTAAALPAAAVLVLLAGATIWLAYARRFPGPRWLAAVAADGTVLLVVSLASRAGGPPENYRSLTPVGTMALALALPLVCLPSFVVRTLVRRRDATPFEAFQSVAALLVGIGGAVQVARSAGIGVGPLAAASLVLGLMCYGAAFGFVERVKGSAKNFHLYSSLGLFLAVAGGAFCLPPLPLILLWSVLAVASAHFGGRYGQMTLRAHGAIYAFSASLAAGLPGAVLDAFLSPGGRPFRPVGPAGLLALAGAVGAYGALVVARKPGIVPKWPRRLPACALAAISLSGAGALAVAALDGREGTLAAVRTGVIASSVLLLAIAGRRPRFWELRWFVPPLLLIGGAKILLEDLPRGRPLTLFAGFASYGVALLLAPRLLRTSHRQV